MAEAGPDQLLTRLATDPMARIDAPHLVAELDGAVIGYAYAVPFRKRPAYRFCVKHSIYVHENHTRAGVGRSFQTPQVLSTIA